MTFCPKCNGITEYDRTFRWYNCRSCGYRSEQKVTIFSFLKRYGDTPLDEIGEDLVDFLKLLEEYKNNA